MNFIHSFPGLLDKLKVQYKPNINVKKEFVGTYDEFLDRIWKDDNNDTYIYVDKQYLPAKNILPGRILLILNLFICLEHFQTIYEIRKLLDKLQCSKNFIEICIEQVKYSIIILI